MHTNIDRAIATVIERGQDVIIPNVFAAYFQCILPSNAPDIATADEMNTVAQAALVSFERAMDKYPMPSRQARTKAKSKTTPRGKAAPTVPAATAAAPTAASTKPRLYSAEVTKLRQEYQESMVRVVAAEYGGECDGCSCPSCTSLAASRGRSALTSEGEDGEPVDVPVRKRRVREYLVLSPVASLAHSLVLQERRRRLGRLECRKSLPLIPMRRPPVPLRSNVYFMYAHLAPAYTALILICISFCHTSTLLTP